MEVDDTRDMGPLMQREKGFKNQSNISCNWLLGGVEPSGLQGVLSSVHLIDVIRHMQALPLPAWPSAVLHS